MPDAVGALAQQQGIAAQIPYKNILLPNPATQFLNAFQLGVEINKKRQQMENAMQALVLKNEQLELQRAREKDEFAYKYDALQKNSDLKEIGLAIRQGALDLATNKFTTSAEDTKGLLQSLTKMEHKPGDPEYPAEINRIFSNFPHAPEALRRDTQRMYEQQHNDQTSKLTASVNADQNLFLKDIKSAMFQGQPHVDTSMFENPEMWKPQYVDPKTGQGVGIDPKTGKYPEGAKFTGKWFVPAGVEWKVGPNGQVVAAPHIATVTEQQKNDWQKRYDSLKERQNNLPSQINNPDTGVYPNTSTAGLAPYPVPQHRQLNQEELDALNWARSHSSDPRALPILKKLGITE